ncbi:MAG: hypothetical protein WCB49_03365 [Gammaproteobacteria bacterium]
MSGSTIQHLPAVVMGGGVTGLGALRSLRLAGIPAYVACPPHDLATRSRWYRPVPGATDWDGNVGPETMGVLRSLPLEQAVLIPCMDDAAIWASDLPKTELGQRFLVSSSPRRTLETLQDKAEFAVFLNGTDIPHPRTFPLRSLADIDTLPFDEFDRMFLKPVNSQKFNQTTGRKALWAESRNEAARLWQQLQTYGLDVMAQEYVPGSPTEHYFLDGFRDRHGTVTGLLARRRLRIYPRDFGNSSYSQSIPLTEIAPAEAHLRELLSKLDYRGIFSAEFKRDARDGQFRILEVNIRVWWYVEFAARCGINVCQMAYDDARGEPVTAASRHYPVGAGCINFPGDIKTVLRSRRREHGPWWRIVGQWSRAHFLAFRPNDPLPGIFASAISIRQVWRRTVGKRPPADSRPPVHHPSANDASRGPP